MIDGGTFAANFDKHAVIVIFGDVIIPKTIRYPFSVMMHGLQMGLRCAFTMLAMRPHDLIEEITKIADAVEKSGPIAFENMEIGDLFLAEGTR